MLLLKIDFSVGYLCCVWILDYLCTVWIQSNMKWLNARFIVIEYIFTLLYWKWMDVRSMLIHCVFAMNNSLVQSSQFVGFSWSTIMVSNPVLLPIVFTCPYLVVYFMWRDRVLCNAMVIYLLHHSQCSNPLQ